MDMKQRHLQGGNAPFTGENLRSPAVEGQTKESTPEWPRKKKKSECDGVERNLKRYREVLKGR